MHRRHFKIMVINRTAIRSRTHLMIPYITFLYMVTETLIFLLFNPHHCRLSNRHHQIPLTGSPLGILVWLEQKMYKRLPYLYRVLPAVQCVDFGEKPEYPDKTIETE